MLSITRLSLDMQSEESQLSFSVKQGDTARRLIITLFEGQKRFIIPDGSYAVFAASKSDGTKFNDSCVVYDGRIQYDLGEQLTAAVGRADCDVTLYSLDGDMISTARFLLVVFKSVFAGHASGVVSENSYGALNSLISNANIRVHEMAELSAAVTEAEAARVEAEAARADENAGIVATATAAAVSASESCGTAVSAANTASGAAEAAEAAKTAAEAARDGAVAIAGGEFAPLSHTHSKEQIRDFAHTHSASEINSGTFAAGRLPVVPVSKGGTGASEAALARANLGAEQSHGNVTFTLTASGWANGIQTVTVAGLSASADVILRPDENSGEAYCAAGIVCTGQAEGSLTFSCAYNPPGEITVNAVILHG